MEREIDLQEISDGKLYTNKDKKIIAIVDYAHNKLSFEKLFSAMIIFG